MTALTLGAAVAHANEADELAGLIQAGRSSEALRMAEQSLARRPEATPIRFLRGVALAELGRTTEALAVFTKLVQDHPDLAEPYNNLGVLYAGMGQHERARLALETSVRLHPGYSTAHENLGDVYATLASLAYSKAMQVDGASVAAVSSKLALIRNLAASKGQVSVATIGVADVDAVAPAPVDPAPQKSPPKGNPTGTPQPASAPRAAAATVPPNLAVAAPSARTEPSSLQSLLNRAAEIEIRLAIEDWAEAQAARRSGREPGEVVLTDLRIDLRGTSATASFVQSRKGLAAASGARKTVRLVERGGRWRVEGERSG